MQPQGGVPQVAITDAAAAVLEDVPTTSSHSHPSVQGSAGCTSPFQSHLTASSVEPQHEPVLTPVFSNVTVAHVFDSSFSMSSSPGIIPVSTFSTLNFALTPGACVTDYRTRSPSFSAALPGATVVPPHIPPTRAQLSTFSTLHGAVDQ